MLDLDVGVVWSQLRGDFEEGVLWEIDKALSYEIPGAAFTAQFQAGHWDGKRHLLTRNHAFMSGFVPRVTDLLKELKVKCTIHDERPTYEAGNHFVPSEAWLRVEQRDYQKRIIESMLKEKRGVVWAVPRSGKTVMLALLIARVRVLPVVVLCERLDIADQNYHVFDRLLNAYNIGVVGDGRCSIGDVTVCTIQSACCAYGKRYGERKKEDPQERPLPQPYHEKIRQAIESAHMVVVDEGHHTASDSYQYILDKADHTEYRYALSGTPWRDDNTDLLIEGMIGPIIAEARYSELIEQGYLAPPYITFIDLPPPAETDADKLPYSTIYKSYVVENDLRNKLIASCTKRLRKSGRTVLIIVRHIPHGKRLKKLIPEAHLVTGQDKTCYRKEVRKNFSDRSYPVVISTLYDEGMDIPSLDAVIIAAAGKSSVKAFQRLRAMTPCSGKKSCTIVDFFDNVGPLRKHSNRRLKLYVGEPKFNVVRRPYEELV